MAEDKNKELEGAEQASKETAQNTKEAKENFAEMALSAEGLRGVLTDVLTELTKAGQASSDTKKAFRSIRDTSTELALIQEGTSKLSQKELIALKEKQERSVKLLIGVTKQTGLTGKALDAQKEAAGFLDEQGGLVKDANDLLDSQIEKRGKIEKSLGRTGAMLKGLSKIPIIGGLVDTKKVTEDLEKSAKGLEGKYLSMTTVIKAFGKEAVESVKDPVVAFGVATKISKGLFDDVKNVVSMLDTFNGKLTKTFAISQKQATGLNKQFREVKGTSDSVFVTVSGLSDSFLALNAQGGTFAEFSAETLETFTKLNKQAGISSETLSELNDLTYLNKGTLEETSKEYAGQLKLLGAQTGFALNQKQLQEEIKNVSSAVKLNYQGSASAIAEAIFKTKALGLEMKDLESITGSLLNFQSSIEDELSAELLTGKQLNLEGARYAALIGDQAMLAEELAANIGSAADFGEMNVIQQDALAKSLGMNKNQLADTLLQTERLNKLNAEGNTLQEKYNNLKAAGNSEQEIAKMLGDDVLQQQLESAGIQETFNVLVENLKEQFLPIAEVLLPMIMNTLNLIGNNMNLLLGVAVAFKAVQIATAAAAFATAFALSPLTAGISFGAALVAAGVLATSIGDGQFDNTTGNFEISKNEGGIFKKWTTSDNDVIQVKPKDVANQGPAASTVNITPSNRKIVMEYNGQVVANGNAMEDYSLGTTVKGFGGAIDYSARTVNS